MIRRRKIKVDNQYHKCILVEAKNACELIIEDQRVIHATQITIYNNIVEKVGKDLGVVGVVVDKDRTLECTEHRMGSYECRNAVEELLLKQPNKVFHGARVVPITAKAFQIYGHMPSEAELESRITALVNKRIERRGRSKKQFKSQINLENEIMCEYRRCVAGRRSAKAFHIVMPEHIGADRFLETLDEKRWSMGVRQLTPVVADLVKSYRLNLISKDRYLNEIKRLRDMVPRELKVLSFDSTEAA
jgi:hypothetical protein